MYILNRIQFKHLIYFKLVYLNNYILEHICKKHKSTVIIYQKIHFKFKIYYIYDVYTYIQYEKPSAEKKLDLNVGSLKSE